MYAAPCQTASGICDDCLCTMLLDTLYVTVSLLPQIHPQVDCPCVQELAVFRVAIRTNPEMTEKFGIEKEVMMS